MRIRELIATGRPSFSFEFFPPKTEAGLDSLRKAVRALRDLNPTFISVTYGAGGSTRERTLDLVEEIQRHYGIEVMAHLTCVGATRSQIGEILQRFQASGVQNTLALRGDPPKDEDNFVPVEDGFLHANELVEFIRHGYPMCVGAACYPEGHPECLDAAGERDLERDLENMRRKVDAGAEFLISQLFFENDAYFDFMSRVRKARIAVPVIPGIMPITNVEQIKRFTTMCGSRLPDTLMREMETLKDRPQAVLSQGVAYATAQCFDLLQRGAPGIHFYTLNRSSATRTILTALRTIWPPARTPA